MNTLTEQFLNLILEKESKDKKPDEKPDEKEVSSSSFKKIEGTTSNKLSLGKPITDAGLSGTITHRYRTHRNGRSAVSDPFTHADRNRFGGRFLCRDLGASELKSGLGYPDCGAI